MWITLSFTWLYKFPGEILYSFLLTMVSKIIKVEAYLYHEFHYQ